MRFDKTEVGEPLCHGALSVFPLFAEQAGASVAYRLSPAAFAELSLNVEELSPAGSVEALTVENRGSTNVLLIEGEELAGAKQNRIVNSSMLLPGGSKRTIAVSCVEQGRWAGDSRTFSSSGLQCPLTVRRILKASIHRSLEQGRPHETDQLAIWASISHLHEKLQIYSHTSAMGDAYRFQGGRCADIQRRLPFVVGATGLAVAVGQQVVAFDLFQNSAVCEYLWKRWISAAVFDSVDTGMNQASATRADVERLLRETVAAIWKQTTTAGDGRDYRTQFGHYFGSLLTVGDSVLHGSVIVEISNGKGARRPPRIP